MITPSTELAFAPIASKADDSLNALLHALENFCEFCRRTACSETENTNGIVLFRK